MCLLRAWHALKENDKYCSTGSLKKVMLQASNKWSLKYLKVLQSFNNPNAKARWLTSTENKSCSQTVRSGLRQSNFSGIFFFDSWKILIIFSFSLTLNKKVYFLVYLTASVQGCPAQSMFPDVLLLLCSSSTSGFAPRANYPSDGHQSHLWILCFLWFFFATAWNIHFFPILLCFCARHSSTHNKPDQCFSISLHHSGRLPINQSPKPLVLL